MIAHANGFEFFLVMVVDVAVDDDVGVVVAAVDVDVAAVVVVVGVVVGVEAKDAKENFEPDVAP